MSDKRNGNTAADAARDKFRAALERKNAKSQAGHPDAHSESKVHGAHDRAGAKRTFRRKSGG